VEAYIFKNTTCAASSKQASDDHVVSAIQRDDGGNAYAFPEHGLFCLDGGNDADDGREASQVQVQIELASQQRVDAMARGGEDHEGGNPDDTSLVI
jgi:hypothetical protein